MNKGKTRKQGSRLNILQQEDFTEIQEGHLGGCALEGDGATYYPDMWDFMIDSLCIESMIDLGCGAGMAADYFKSCGVSVLGIEGTRGAIDNGLLSEEDGEVVQHDYEVEPYLLTDKKDFAWTCEFVEHVSDAGSHNFMRTLQSCRIVAMTFAPPGQGGYNHVNEQPAEYWIQRFQQYGFKLMNDYTFLCRKIAESDWKNHTPFYMSHFIKSGLVFENKNF